MKEQYPIKCFHCNQETTFKVSERFQKTSINDITVFFAAVICNKCDKLVGFADTWARTEIAALKLSLENLEKASN